MRYSYIGVVIADGCEYEPFKSAALKRGALVSSIGGMECVRFNSARIKVTAVLCGIGKVNAASAAAFLISEGANLLVSTGYSGGISGIARGMTSIATRFAEHDFDLTPLGYDFAQKPDQVYEYDADEYANSALKQLYPQVREGVMVSGDCFVCDDALRGRLKDRFNAMSCDMESAAVASVGYKAGVGTVAIRQISDDAGNNANELYRCATGEKETSMTDMTLGLIDFLAEAE